MTRSARILRFNVVAALFIGIAVGARAADLTQPMILVASSVLDGTAVRADGRARDASA